MDQRSGAQCQENQRPQSSLRSKTRRTRKKEEGERECQATSSSPERVRGGPETTVFQCWRIPRGNARWFPWRNARWYGWHARWYGRHAWWYGRYAWWYARWYGRYARRNARWYARRNA